MSKIAIVYHSGFGHTKVVAESVEKGAKNVEGAEVTLIPVAEVDDHWETLENSDAIVFGSPTYMGTVSAPFKEFMDKSSKQWLEQKWKNKIAGGFTNSSSPSGDKLNTLTTLAVFAAQQSMIWVGAGTMPYVQTPHGLTQNRLGSFLGVMTQAGNVAPEVEPNADDKFTAEQFGERVATITAQFIKGK
ncbi:MAG: flavodoxin family protein [Pyrinomonadaceae bacterium]|nr:flavodoxin family protein [Pyrinomonadaceae bacterium]